MKKITKIILDACLLGTAVLMFLVLTTAVFVCGYSSIYLVLNFDRLSNDLILSIAKIDAVAARLDSHAQFLIRKTNQIEKTPIAGKPGPKGEVHTGSSGRPTK